MDPQRRSQINGKPAVVYIERGTRNFTQFTLALFSSGFATFALLYCVQPLLPILSHEFLVSPATSSLALSVSTGTLAIGLIFTGPLSDALGRKKVIVTALLLAALSTLLCAVAVNWHTVLIARALLGLSLSGVAAVAMTYLSEEIHPEHVVFTMGLYISGNSIGGMSGRLIVGALTDLTSWRAAMACLGCLALLASLLFWRLAPESRHFRPISLRLPTLLTNFRLHWHDRALLVLFMEGFLLMGTFVTLFNYIAYRLIQAPYSLNPTWIGLLSLVYIVGAIVSPRINILTKKMGTVVTLACVIGVMILGILLTLLAPFSMILLGMSLCSAGFFAAHALASSLVGQRARRARGQASALYLFFYYLGSSVAGTLGGFFWFHYQWNGVVTFLSLLLFLAFSLSIGLKKFMAQ